MGNDLRNGDKGRSRKFSTGHLPAIRVQIQGWRHGKLVFFVLFNMARGFENVGEIISD